MYVCILETGRGFFEGVCTPSNATAHSCDPPPTQRPEPHCQDSGPKKITNRATVDGDLAWGRGKTLLAQCPSSAHNPPAHHAQRRTHVPQSIASRYTPETLPPVVSRLPGARVEEEPVGIPAVREVEQILEASGLGVEGLIAYPAQSPVILDKAQDRGLVRDRVIHEILLGVRGDHLQGQPRTVAAAVLVRSRLGITAHPRPGEEVVLGVARVVDDRPHLVVVPAAGVVLGDDD